MNTLSANPPKVSYNNVIFATPRSVSGNVEPKMATPTNTLVWRLLICCWLTVLNAAEQRQFPRLHLGTSSLKGFWKAAPIVAVGDLRNVKRFGRQELNLPILLSASKVTSIYWCQGEFVTVAAIRGNPGGSVRKYLWATGPAGCLVSTGDQKEFAKLKTRIWFLRVEGEYLRPLFDAGNQIVGLRKVWQKDSENSPSEQLGELLLDPSASCRGNWQLSCGPAGRLWSHGMRPPGNPLMSQAHSRASRIWRH